MLNTAGLSLEQGPPIAVPFRFSLTALTLLVGGYPSARDGARRRSRAGRLLRPPRRAAGGCGRRLSTPRGSDQRPGLAGAQV